MTGTRNDKGRLISASHVFPQAESLGCKQRFNPDEPLEPTRLPHYALMPHAFELAAGLKRPCVGRWLLIGVDALLIEDELDEPEQEPPEGSTISIDEILANLSKKNPLAAMVFKKRLSKIEEKYNRELREEIEALRNSEEEPDVEFLDPSNPYRVIDHYVNQGMDPEVFRELMDHPMMVEGLQDTFEDPSKVMESLASGRLALVCDRKTREIYVVEHDDACDLVEYTPPESGIASPVQQLNELMAPFEKAFGPEYVRKATEGVFIRIMRDELDAFTQRKDRKPPSNVVVISVKARERR